MGVLRILFVSIAFLFLSACATSLPRVDVVKKGFHNPCRVVLLPFINQTKDPALSRLLYRLFLNALVEDPHFQVVPEGQVRRFIVMERFMLGQPLSPSLMHLLARRTGAEAIVTGEILSVEKVGDNIQLAFVVRVEDINTGKLLWSTYHKRSAEDYRKILHFGRIYTLTGLANNMVKEVMAAWRENSLGGCR